MTIAAIRADLNTIVAAVTDAGVVHDTMRWAAEWNVFLDLFKTTIGGVTQIRGWCITYNGYARPPEPLEVQHVGSGDVLRDHRFLIRGWLGLDDSAETEKTAANLSEAVCDALDGSTTLHDGATYYDAGLAEMAVFEERSFGGTICHFTEIVQTVTERV